MKLVRISERREQVIKALVEQGAVLLKGAISPDHLPALVVETEGLEYETREPYYGPRQVPQQLDGANIIGPQLHVLADSIEREVSFLLGEGAFAEPLRFTARNAQRYKNGSLGIGTHQDLSENRGLVGIVGLAGIGRFSILADLTPESEVITSFDIEPGDIAFMAAPGFLHMNLRPYHKVDEIRGNLYRYILGLRQR